MSARRSTSAASSGAPATSWQRSVCDLALSSAMRNTGDRRRSGASDRRVVLLSRGPLGPSLRRTRLAAPSTLAMELSRPRPSTP